MKIIYFRSLILIATFLIFTNCKDSTPETYKLPQNAIELICGKEEKVWKLAKRLNNNIRMNMGNCFLSYRQHFRNNMTMNDNNGKHNGCGESLNAKWEIVKNENGISFIKIESNQLPKLMNIEDNFKYFQILELTKEKLTVTYQHKQFSNKVMWIKDFYVPESVKVKDRDFHNK